MYKKKELSMTLNEESDDRRTEERVHVSLPVNRDGKIDLTRDISTKGVYFEANETFTLGDRIDFEIEFSNRGGMLKLNCHGEIVRLDDRNGKVGVAVRIVSSEIRSN
jgi:hypothetical protein